MGLTGARSWAIATNAAYPVAAWLAIGPDKGPAGWAFMAAVTILGAASTYYHAGGKDGNHADVAAMYAVGGALFALALGLEGWPAAIGAALLGGAAGGLLRFGQLDVPMERKILGLYGIVAIGTGLRGVDPETAALALLALAIGGAARFPFWWPEDWEPIPRDFLHGVWHLYTAAGLALWAAALLAAP